MDEPIIKQEAGCCAKEHLPAGKLSGTGHHHHHSHHNHPPGHHHDEDGHAHDHIANGNVLRLLTPSVVSFILLFSAIMLDNWVPQNWFNNWLRLVWYIAAYLPVGIPVVKDAFISIKKGDVFSEFFLMTIATAGAFALGEYPEAVAVMLFYAVGEVFQTLAVSRAKGNIKALLDQRPDEVTVLRKGQPQTIPAETATIGDILQLKPGEKLALDGELLTDGASFNTAALTGESTPDTKAKGDAVLAGMINLHTVSKVRVTAAYTDSKLSRILELVQHATTQKAPTELFIRKFARVYTPVVVFLALGICLLPWLFVEEYRFGDWLYRALVFLVISCPCALVISIPLGYFGGIGAASRNGILFKGSNFLDIMSGVKQVVMDKTGTLTEGVFSVQEVVVNKAFDKDNLLQMVNALESHSSHPVASAIHAYAGPVNHMLALKDTEEIAGHGLKTTIHGKELLVGNFRLMERYGIACDADLRNTVYTTIAIAYGGVFAGYITIADSIKPDARLAIDHLKKLNVTPTMLSGDKSAVVQKVAAELGIAHAYGDLLPEDKVRHIAAIRAGGETVAFAGDGVNDAPVVALSDVGIAMGGLGSDATIETADVVIQDDKPLKIPIAIRIGRETKKIVWQNILLAFGIKAIVLILGAGGLATMWEAVFADVGVALLAIVNAIRIQRMKFI